MREARQAIQEGGWFVLIQSGDARSEVLSD
jgi:hypothetical protein